MAQERIVYGWFINKTPSELMAEPRAHGFNATRHVIQVHVRKGGETLEIPTELTILAHTNQTSQGPMVVLFIGRGGHNRSADVRIKYMLQNTRNLRVAVYHYIGYGSPGRTTEALLHEQATQVIQYIHARRTEYRVSSLTAYGVSMGTVIASYVARADVQRLHEYKVDGLALETPMYDARSIMRGPLKLAVRLQWNTAKNAMQANVPILIAAGVLDRITPYTNHSGKLYSELVDAGKEVSMFLELTGHTRMWIMRRGKPPRVAAHFKSWLAAVDERCVGAPAPKNVSP